MNEIFLEWSAIFPAGFFFAAYGAIIVFVLLLALVDDWD